jgi:hypothetical protein
VESKLASAEVHIVFDSSYAFIAGKYHAARREGLSVEQGFRLHFPSLSRLAHAGRPVAGVYAAGSGRPASDTLWVRAADAGLPVKVVERGADSQGEVGVDATMQCGLVRALLDATRPGVLVLMTGDGAADEDGEGFLADARRASQRGFGVELLAWGSSCSAALREFVDGLGDHGAFVDLRRFYSQISYIEGQRKPIPLSLRGRPLAVPRASGPLAFVA